MKVYVYFNLHKKLWSIKALEGPKKGLVIGHSEYVHLRDCAPKVSEKGRQRVLKERRKNVHAGITGTLVATEFPSGDAGVYDEVSYNPYKGPEFRFKDVKGNLGHSWKGSKVVKFYNKRVFASVGELR